jgi:hypothetical protein
MKSHPLFDETVVDRLRAVTDALVPFLPATLMEIDLIVKPGPAETPGEAIVESVFPAGDGPANWTLPPESIDAARSFAAAWLATGHPMPAFRFRHQRMESGQWRATTEPLTEW